MQDVQLAADGTRKLVSVLTSGEGAGKKVETVIIPMLRYEDAPTLPCGAAKLMLWREKVLGIVAMLAPSRVSSITTMYFAGRLAGELHLRRKRA